MKCAHCLVEFFPQGHYQIINEDIDGFWFAKETVCPSCQKLNIFLVRTDKSVRFQRDASIFNEYASFIHTISLASWS